MKTVALDTVLCINGVSVAAKTTHILNNVTFASCSGDFLAVMGPSGAGKTTLLNAIAGRQPLSTGEITLSGKNFDKQLRRRLGFVLQEDVFFSRLTLWETLYFTAMIRLPEHISRAEKIDRVDEIVNMLDIRKCVNTVIGDMFERGLSGGEKKRASIACELLTDPDILLLDEPTSGLDSSTALSLIRQMKTFAAQYNKTIIVSIHQPSSQIYHMFDSLLLLANGKVAYYGGAHKEPLDFLEQVGFKCDAMYNPADFFLEVLKADQAKIDEIVCAYKQKSVIMMNELATKQDIDRNGTFNNGNKMPEIVFSDSLKKSNSTSCIISKRYSSGTIVTFDDLDTGTMKSSAQQRWPTGFYTQFFMLSWRNFKQSRGRILHLYDVIHYATMAVIASMLFFQISSDANVARDKMGACFFCVTFWTFAPAFEAILAFPAEIRVISKERAAGAYRLSAYYFAKTISELPLLFLMPTLFYTIIYWMAGLNGVQEFFITWPILIMSVFSAQGLGYFLGAAIPDVKIAFLTGNTVILISLLFSGFITQSIPQWISWVKYLSHIHYPLSAICIIVFDNMEPLPCNGTSVRDFPKCLQNETAVITSKDILYEAGMVLPIYCYLATFALIFIFLRVAAYLALRFRRHIPK
ncbi:uncharacterized protein LOC123534894 [Mercenaria mercenaria]|uniref:uncharacterized protein LOC123534894 n=1 Tax=Mercenaria mercenaria TaxID=6596 RepID=UPI00234E5A72|nr:uncharacterized protein LOC123534894 [Mercenaria mercenaria]